MKPSAVDVSKVQDAIVVLKSRGDPHYRTDIARFTGLPLTRVDRVIDHLEARAKSNPTGKITIPWTRMRGDKGGIATSSSDRQRGARQRKQAIKSQSIRQMERCEAEYRRSPGSRDWAIDWATAARGVGRVEFKSVRDEINVLFLDAMLAKGLPTLEAIKEQLVLMAEIDAL